MKESYDCDCGVCSICNGLRRLNKFNNDNTIIPKGIYCYDEKGRCPYFSHIEKAGIKIPYCKYLKEGSLPNELTDEDFERLKNFHHTTSDEDIWNLYPLDFLWDQVKECGENN